MKESKHNNTLLPSTALSKPQLEEDARHILETMWVGREQWKSGMRVAVHSVFRKETEGEV